MTNAYPGRCFYYKNENNDLHRANGPAKIMTTSAMEPRVSNDGVRHKSNGPVWMLGATKWEWCLNGLLHRYYGPQSDYGDWWIHHTRVK